MEPYPREIDELRVRLLRFEGEAELFGVTDEVADAVETLLEFFAKRSEPTDHVRYYLSRAISVLEAPRSRPHLAAEYLLQGMANHVSAREAPTFDELRAAFARTLTTWR